MIVANINITYKGLTGIRSALTIDDGQTMAQLRTAIIADEALSSAYYGRVSLHKNGLVIDSTDNAATTLASAGMVSGDMAIVSTAKQTTKEAQQVMSLAIAQLKRRGGNAADDTAPYFRTYNTYDINALSLKYAGNVPGNNAETYDPLQPRRPWLTGGAGAAPETVEEAVPQATLDRLQTNYDASTNTYIKPPSLSSGGTITQWTDQSVFAHNLNSGGSARPTWHSNVKNSKGVLRFDGTNDCLNINPVAWLNSVPQATFFIVCKPTATTGDSVMGSDQGDLRVYSDTGAWKVGMAGATAGQASGTDANISAGSWYYLTVVYDGTAGTNADRLKFKVNGTAITLSYTGTVGATTSATNTEFAVGCYNSTEFFAGDISEVLVFDTLLITPEINAIESYLAARWAI